jgi:hypothetical protein
VLDDFDTVVSASVVAEDPATGRRTSLGAAPVHFFGYAPRVRVRYGVAWFQGLRLDNASLVWTLNFTSSPPLESVASRPIHLLEGAAAGIKVLVRPAGCFAEEGGGGVACRSQPVVAAIDLGGNVIESFNETVNATVSRTLPGGGESGVLGWFAQQAEEGVAAFSDFTIHETGADYLLRFAAPSASALVRNVTVSSAGTKLRILQEPIGFVPGEVALVQPWVALEDARGRVVDSDFGTPLAAVFLPPEVDYRPNPGAPIPVAGTTVVPDVAGVSRFTNLRLDAPGKCFVLSLVPPERLRGAVAPALSLPFNIARGAVHQVLVTREPAGVVPGQPFEVQPQIAMTDLGGNVILDDSETVVTAQIFQQPTTALKGAGRALPLAAGRAAFAGLSVELADDCMQLEFRAVGRITAYSRPFQVPRPRRTKWTRRVPHPVLIGHAAFLTPY